MGAFVFGASDFGNASIGRNDKDGSHVGFEGAVEEGEAFHV